MFYRFEPCSDLSNETKHFDFGLIFWHVLTHSHGVGPISIGLTLVREGGCTCNTTPRHFGPLSCMRVQSWPIALPSAHVPTMNSG